MIKIHNLRKVFDAKVIFNDFQLEIPNGQFVIFTGKSGAGKTTLLNMIGGLEQVTDGEIQVDSYTFNSNTRTPRSFFQTKVGFVFQNYGLVDNKTVRQNLEMVHKKYRTRISVMQALENVGMERVQDQAVYKLSGGEQQRIALARLMLKKCDIILADEPTGSLDWENAQHVIEIIQQLNQNGKTIIMVTHDQRLLSSAERIVKL